MSETTTGTNGVTIQYAAQVAGDLERNLKEQERIAGEITLLQEQLASLEKDRSVLLNVQQALGVEPASTAPAAEPPTVPAPRKKAAAAAGASRQTKAKKSAPAAPKPAGKKKAPNKAAAEPAQPSLVSLVREHLAGQSEPRSAAEIAQSLGQQHPERGIKTTVVRTTLEGLVAKNHAQRTKQGTSVFYTSPETPAPATGQEQDPQQGQPA
ncbi:hypothetical protein [Streptomyces aurantiogriseus]|uniref:Regulatory protein n=1 Tax=Streptomyces aurantiogriseus TaxID=66870 RepID=A0A918L0E2_9ACTN|nr:hypothetical protein [Streptomyces aurantiogriseus]GGR64933.1 hypothetical protein GCM10010251_96840 [Streptomyces aurantiogriseus]